MCTLHVAWPSVLCDQEHTLHPCGRHGPVVSESADMWYMVSRVEYCVDIVFADILPPPTVAH